MTEAHHHVPDAQLLLHRSGELPAALSTDISAHVEGCSQCRARLEKLESTFAEFSTAHLEASDMALPSAAVARARLQEHLAEVSVQRGEDGGRRRAARGSVLLPNGWVALVERRSGAVLAALAMAACLLFAMWLHGPGKKSYSLFGAMSGSTSGPFSAALSGNQLRSEPDLRLTPGATLPVTQNQVCGAESSRITSTVPVSLKRKVFEEYGVVPPQPDAYEVDYLITPELGGATDIRNLWPEPYQDTVWNAHVKDQLEDRLHRMVCRGDVDLATAQHDISTDWIAAYRKYFHADKPVTDNSSFNSAGARHSHPLT
jgi:hypothetical protein